MEQRFNALIQGMMPKLPPRPKLGSPADDAKALRRDVQKLGQDLKRGMKAVADAK